MRKRLFASIALAVLVGGPAWAHHSMEGVFDFNQRFTRTGTVTEVDWRNPHIYVFVDVQDDLGQSETWAFEGPSPTFFRNPDNANKSDFENAIGETVTVEASRARDNSLSGLIRMITLPDGTVVSLCPQNC